MDLRRIIRSSAAWKRFHLVRVVCWIVLLPVALLTPLKESVPFLVAISILAPLLSDLASWRVDTIEDETDDDDQLAARVADEVIRRLDEL